MDGGRGVENSAQTTRNQERTTCVAQGRPIRGPASISTTVHTRAPQRVNTMTPRIATTATTSVTRKPFQEVEIDSFGRVKGR